MWPIYVLLTIIAIGVLLLSRPGRIILILIYKILFWITILMIIGFVLAISGIWLGERNFWNKPINQEFLTFIVFAVFVIGLFYTLFNIKVFSKEGKKVRLLELPSEEIIFWIFFILSIIVLTFSYLY